jgi:peptide/nickel transport system substrate-binding protein
MASWRAVACIGILVLVATGCVAQNAKPLAMTDSREIRLGQHDSPRSMNDAGGLSPDLSTQVPTRENHGISRDGRTITYLLRHDAVWEDGTPITTADVLFTYRALVEPRNNIIVPSAYREITSLSARSPYEFEVRLRQPDWSFVALFFAPSTPIVPAHIFRKGPAELSDPGNGFAEKPLSGGPYRFVAWNRDDDLLLHENYRYFGPKPRAPLRLEFMDYGALSIGLVDGSLDAAFDVPVSVYSRLRNAPNLRTFLAPACGYSVLLFNMKKGPGLDLSVRRAFILGIDQAFLARAVTDGIARPYSGLEGAFSPFHDRRIQPLRFDPARASALLERSGWQLGHNGVLEKGGKPLELLFILGDDEISQRAALLVQSYERKIGIRVVLKTYTPEQLVAPDNGPLATGKFDVLFATMYGYSPLLPRWWFFCASDYNENPGHYCSPQSESAYGRAMRSLNEADKRDDFRELERRFVDDVAVVPLWRRFRVDVCRAELGGCGSGQVPPTSEAYRLHWKTAR